MGLTSTLEKPSFPVSFSSGVLGLKREFDQAGRLNDLMNVIPNFQDKVGRSVGVELNMVDVSWLSELLNLLKGETLRFFQELADQGGVLSLHTPNGVNYGEVDSAETAAVIKNIHRVHEVLPITNDVVHVDLAAPERRLVVAEAMGRDSVVFEATDGRNKGYPARTVQELSKLVEQGLYVLIDLGHVQHACLVEQFPNMIQQLGT